MAMIFEGFTLQFVDVPEARLRVRFGGFGPPVLLLHGHPRTHAAWHRVAAILARDHTVICPDLRGFGQSSQAADRPDHGGSSKRAKARDCVTLMHQFGHERFAVVGEDRGALTAFRMAPDYPEVVTHLCLIDAVPIIDVLERCDLKAARLLWQWFFYAEVPRAERAILNDPDEWYGGSARRMGQEAYDDYRIAIHNPSTIHGMVEDFRAGFSVDRLHDAQDRAHGKRIGCPTLAFWSARGAVGQLYDDPLTIWRDWAPNLRGRAFECDDTLVEEAPEELAGELLRFMKPDRLTRVIDRVVSAASVRPSPLAAFDTSAVPS